eukprot:TRINITY_DN12129_c0_g1_i1.p1 TRINITY_DN12129_c0_g1~~TRINITY_DN12129_c0_g1_i1.p1  ORF type:complete len:195 (+),score=17.44 TRINITY_DN12129_c0_g1_i1:129-713(+)
MNSEKRSKWMACSAASRYPFRFSLTLPWECVVCSHASCSLLNELQAFDMRLEESFFSEHPALGEFVHWPIIGNLLPPMAVGEPKRSEMALNLDGWAFDHLPSRIPMLNKRLLSAGNSSVIIYIHCEAGMDRTGEVSGSYYIGYLGWSFQRALYYDQHNVESRNISVESRNAFQWYCLYLQASGLRPTIDCTTGV